MAKLGIRFNDLGPVLKRTRETTAWSLCVGAGTSKGIFPDWRGLVARLVERDPASTATLSARLLAAHTPEALIEAAARRLNVPDYGALLAELLYSDLRSEAGSDWGALVPCLEAEHIGALQRSVWAAFLSFFRSRPRFSNASALEPRSLFGRMVRRPACAGFDSVFQCGAALLRSHERRARQPSQLDGGLCPNSLWTS